MAIVRKPEQTDQEKLGLEINNGDYKALKRIKDKFNFVDEEAALRFALAVLTQTHGDTVYIEDDSGSKVGLQPSDSLRGPRKMTTKRASNDFNPDDLTKKSDEHDKLLNALEERVGTNENFGKTFKSSASDSKSIDSAIEKIVIKILEHNVDAQSAIAKTVKDIDNRDMKKQLIGTGKLIAWIVSLVITAAVTAWVSN